MIPPFQNNSKIKCINDSPEMWYDGREVDVCRCTKDEIYTADFCIWAPVGWLVVITGELHKASDFISIPEFYPFTTLHKQNNTWILLDDAVKFLNIIADSEETDVKNRLKEAAVTLNNLQRN
jgi:hypothetical protein